jgi:hypothetical protein
MSTRIRRLAQDRNVQLGSIAAAPPLWFAVAWADARMLVVALASACAAAWALRALERRRTDDDEPLWL